MSAAGRPPEVTGMRPCPTCGAPVQGGPDLTWRPFCSERCKLLDFGAWLSETYRVPAVERDDEDAPPPDSAGR